MRSDRLGIIENSDIIEEDRKAIIKETYLQGHHRLKE
jgi:hypothetical protein